MDFYKIQERSMKNGVIEVYPDFIVRRSNDLMVRGKAFYAIWDEEARLWSEDEYDVARLMDDDLNNYAQELRDRTGDKVRVRKMTDFSSKAWREFRSYMSLLSDNFHQLDEQLTFANQEVRKRDYISRKLPYPLEAGETPAWDEMMHTLYAPEELEKLEWSIGSIVSGDSRRIQKFVVLYGSRGTGKSTVLNVIESLFDGYTSNFEAKALVGNNNSFATEVFRGNPLVAIQQDGDLSRIEDNTILNSIVSHEMMVINEKHKPAYSARLNAMLFLGTNKPVMITDAKSGIIRRLIDVSPTGTRIPFRRYQTLMMQIGFELGAIAQHCLDVYLDKGEEFYDDYKPINMMYNTDVFFNFVSENFDTFKRQEYVSLNQAYEMYKEYCDESLITRKLAKYKFRDELMNYFTEFHIQKWVDGVNLSRVYQGFKTEMITTKKKEEQPAPLSLILDQTESIFDKEFADAPAQGSRVDKDTGSEVPLKPWAEVLTTLQDLDTSTVHFVRVPENHIVIDFDLRGDDGEKSMERNLEAASQWPATYAEFSKSGSGIHLHYRYTGDISKLSRVYSDGIEIKVFTGNASLRRKLSLCNSVAIATLNGGLPEKEKKVINQKAVASERAIRDLIIRNLRKEIHPGTKPSIDFINKILEDAYNSGMPYDVSDLRPRVMGFAGRSTNQSGYCLKLVASMKFSSEENPPESRQIEEPSEAPIVFFDTEVFCNLFVICWKYQGAGTSLVRMVNPTPAEVEEFIQYRLIGYNCRDYDNHILYARMMGYTNEQLYNLSQRIIKNSPNAKFREAYNISYADIYDFLNSENKMSLKKWEIKLGIHHQELGHPWDQPVPDELVDKVCEYCENDVVAEEAVFDHNQGDFKAREILAQLSGLSINDKTQTHTARIIFGEDKRPQDKFVYTNLADIFPGYTHEFGKSSYRGEDPGEGGYVYSEPGYYTQVALLDVESMHPNSLINLNAFGPYTERFKELLDARMAVKHGDFDKARQMLGGALAPFLEDTSGAKPLAYGLKIVINIVYGLTSAKFENKFKDPANVDNIVAKRGALFMINLKHEVQERGFIVAHIKTDSIKIPNATPEIIQFVMDYGKQYGYTFAHEATYKRMCLVNKAVYVAQYSMKDGEPCEDWTSTGAQFQHPYVFKSLFTHEPIVFADMCETRAVTTALYLDFNEDLPEDEHSYTFVGKIGAFCPIKDGKGGGLLLREKDGKYYSAPNSKGFRWMESEMVTTLDKEGDIEKDFFEGLVDEAVANIEKYVSLLELTG